MKNLSVCFDHKFSGDSFIPFIFIHPSLYPSLDMNVEKMSSWNVIIGHCLSVNYYQYRQFCAFSTTWETIVFMARILLSMSIGCLGTKDKF